LAHVPRNYIEAVDELVRRGIFPNRSEAIRAAIRELLERYCP
jgi:Arc/MetJ-type ribon-helix-helix transcriptional regulator